MTVQTAVLTYENDKGETLVRLVHKSSRLPERGGTWTKGSTGYEEAPDWVAEFAHPYGWENNGGGLPGELGPGRSDAIQAVTVADATEALARIGAALESWISARQHQDALLVQRVAAAARYGAEPELPLGETADQALGTGSVLTSKHREERMAALERGERA